MNGKRIYKIKIKILFYIKKKKKKKKRIFWFLLVVYVKGYIHIYNFFFFFFPLPQIKQMNSIPDNINIFWCLVIWLIFYIYILLLSYDSSAKKKSILYLFLYIHTYIFSTLYSTLTFIYFPYLFFILDR